MKNKPMRFFTLILFIQCICLYAQPWSGIVDPSRATDWSQAGVAGGIPNRTTICATFNPGASASQINAAIAACNNGVVYLNAGTYNLSSGLIFNAKSNVTLRGAGPDQTSLVFTGTNDCGGYAASICVMGSNGWTGGFSGGPVNWTGGYTQGSTTITLASTAGLAAGQYIILDQLDDTSDPFPEVLNSGGSGFSTQGGPGGRSSRSQMQFVKITAVNGNNVSITPGLQMANWRSSRSPQVWWTGTWNTFDGIENLTLDHSSNTEMAGITFHSAANSWVKNVRSIRANRNHIWAILAAHIQVQDSYFYGTKNAASQSYGFETFGASDNLIQNNIFQHVSSPIMVGNVSGQVVSYNYMTDHFVNFAGWLMGSINGHDAGVNMVLIEGNTTGLWLQDSLHGTQNFFTGFRNYLSGWESGKTGNTNPFTAMAYNRFSNVVGNVLGRAGYHTKYEDSYGAANGDPNHSIYLLGFAESGETTSSAGVNADSRVKATLMRWGNYDVVTNSVRWNASEVPSGLSKYANPVPSSQNLPASFYLSSKPSWWTSSVPWPPIGPDVNGGTGPGGKAYDIPAQVCFNNTGNDPAFGSLNVRLFNANKCYAQASTPTPKPAAPTNLSAIVK
jgi:hypothetical protein